MPLHDATADDERSLSAVATSLTTPRSLVGAYAIELLVFLALLGGIYTVYATGVLGFTQSLIAVAVLVGLELLADRFVVPALANTLDS